jgi:hypothetical protein
VRQRVHPLTAVIVLAIVLVAILVFATRRAEPAPVSGGRRTGACPRHGGPGAAPAGSQERRGFVTEGSQQEHYT